LSEKRTYVVVYERDEAEVSWNVRVAGIDGCQTYGRSLRAAKGRMREALALWLGCDSSTLDLEDRLPARLASVAKRANRARREAERAAARAQQEVAGAARELTELGLSRRDAAELLGLSHQRVQQLVDGS
jgi:predicted RNase H-like HicB family nuclease